MKIEKIGEIEVIVFDNLTQTDLVKHCFTTRRGGVSEGYYSAMNMGLTRGEDKVQVLKNFDILGNAMGFSKENYVTSQQTHTTNVRRITAADKGKGVLRERGYADVDGLITNEPNIPLVIFGADCVPVFLLDTKHKAIGMAHSGWMGTANRMAEHILQEMMQEFGTKPKDVAAAIGPSIGKCCFQVDEPVVALFRENLAFADEIIFDDPSESGKYRIDLWETNRRFLADMGVENIEIAGLCTMCDTDRFYSHRKMREHRGVMAGVMELKG
ncbi:MAG: peptidoglycan editing factor PgeF [Clostridia bacterium]|nr:peptidoglycan editing factor PgeF [Clostridia bacterium]